MKDVKQTGIANMYAARAIVAAAMVLATSIGALAWSDKTTNDRDYNTVCEYVPGAQCAGAIRMDADLSGVDMEGASMTTMRLDRSNLSRANLERAILHMTNLEGANLTFANLTGAHMHAVNLQGADLMMANLTGVNLLDADLRGANFSGCKNDRCYLVRGQAGQCHLA